MIDRHRKIGRNLMGAFVVCIAMWMFLFLLCTVSLWLIKEPSRSDSVKECINWCVDNGNDKELCIEVCEQLD